MRPTSAPCSPSTWRTTTPSAPTGPWPSSRRCPGPRPSAGPSGVGRYWAVCTTSTSAPPDPARTLAPLQVVAGGGRRRAHHAAGGGRQRGLGGRADVRRPAVVHGDAVRAHPHLSLRG